MLKYFISENLNSKQYFLANKDCFFHRYCDTGFKTKWTGFWNGYKKMIEFFAFKVNDVWLSEWNCEGFEHDYVRASHIHWVDNTRVLQQCFIPKESCYLEITLDSEKECEIELMLAINMRFREENLHNRKYDVSLRNNILQIKSELGKLFIKLPEKSIFEKRLEYRTHEPSGEKQCYFVPGIIKYFGNSFSVKIGSVLKETCERSKKEILEKKYRLIESDNELLENLYRSAIANIELLKTKRGFYAGLPWFLELWARDMLLSVDALLYLGDFEKAKEILELFFMYENNGKIPNYIYRENIMYNSVDASILMLIQTANYVNFSKDFEFLKKHESELRRILTQLISRTNENGFIIHDVKESETRMDTLRRDLHAIEIQAMFIKALEIVERFQKYYMLFTELQENVQEVKQKLQKNFLKKFFPEENSWPADRIKDGYVDLSKRPNALLARLYVEFPLNIKEYEKDDMLCDIGVRTLSSSDEKFSGMNYHNGQAWSLCTAWLICNEFILGRTNKGFELMKLYWKLFNKDTAGFIPECWNSETYELKGCGAQLWGASFIIRAIDEYMLGITVNGREERLSVNPKLPDEVNYVKRFIRIADWWFELLISKNNTSIRKLNRVF